MNKMLCFDMDNTIADLYNVPDWLLKLRAEDVSPYENASPMWDMSKLNESLRLLQNKGWEINIITWLAKSSSEKYKKQTREAKKKWLAKYDFPYEHFYGVQYGTTKSKSVRKRADYAILIDDNEKIRQGWTLGKTIDPTRENIIEILQKMLDKP